MKLIADSGATKTDWCIGHSTSDCRIIHTQGINPFHQSKEHINKVLEEELMPQLEHTEAISHIYFYGAGCTPEKSLIVKEALQALFTQAEIQVESDLLGAARSLCGKEPGIACILGTGSNSCEYDGEKIVSNISPLGYILGDEGSGAYLGKHIASDCLKMQAPEHIRNAFFKKTGLTPAEIIEKVYRQPQANRFLASLAPFLSEYRTDHYIYKLLTRCFSDFFIRNLMKYNYQELKVHFTGSIAWHFQEEIKEAAFIMNIRTGKFIQSPIYGLIDYHL